MTWDPLMISREAVIKLRITSTQLKMPSITRVHSIIFSKFHQNNSIAQSFCHLITCFVEKLTTNKKWVLLALALWAEDALALWFSIFALGLMSVSPLPSRPSTSSMGASFCRGSIGPRFTGTRHSRSNSSLMRYSLTTSLSNNSSFASFERDDSFDAEDDAPLDTRSDPALFIDSISMENKLMREQAATLHKLALV